MYAGEETMLIMRDRTYTRGLLKYFNIHGNQVSHYQKKE